MDNTKTWPQEMAKAFWRWVLPPICVLCNQNSDSDLDLCNACLHNLPWCQSACERCGLPTASTTPLCGTCLQAPPVFNGIRCALWYQQPVDWLIHQFKFHGTLSYTTLLAELLYRKLSQTKLPPPDVIIPIPLHPNRWRSRGFNQALELARPIAKKLQRPLLANACQRVIDVPQLSQMTAKQRRQQVQQAFQINPANIAALHGRHVVLLDDVVTTGATVNALAKILHQHEVASVQVWALARVAERD